MNQEYYDELEDLEDNYHPIFDFRPSKWLYNRIKESENTTKI